MLGLKLNHVSKRSYGPVACTYVYVLDLLHIIYIIGIRLYNKIKSK